jgi:hypothetical protein
MPLATLPGIHRLTLAVVEAVPEWHPEHATFTPFPVYAWLVRHPDGPILVDAGVGIGHPLIDVWYRPRITALEDALGAVGIDLSDVAGVVLSPPRPTCTTRSGKSRRASRSGAFAHSPLSPASSATMRVSFVIEP